MRKPLFRYTKTLFFLVIIFGLGGYFWFNTHQTSTLTYLTEPAKIQDISLTVLADGTLQAYKQVSVGSQVSGQIRKLHVALGDIVKKGDLLVEIDDLPQKNALADAKARLKNIEATKAAKLANLINAQLTLERQSVLSKQGATRVSELDTAKANLDALVAEIEAINAQISQTKIALDTAVLNLSYTQITAPMDGMIVALIVDEGQTVNSVQSAPTLIKIATLSTMTVKAQISEADVIKISPGMPVYFTILGDKKRYYATLRQIEPAPESIQTDTKTANTSTSEAIYYNGLFDVDNSESKLKISMTAQVVITVDEAKNALVIPASALQINKKNESSNANTKADNKADNKKNMLPIQHTIRVLKEDGTVENRNVTLGLNNNIYVQILEGLTEGEHVIISDSTGPKSSQMPRGMGKP